MKDIISRIKKDLTTPLAVQNADKLQHPDEIVVCGMGGSGMLGMVLAEITPSLPVRIHRSFGLPARVAENTLFLIVSYSGETKETLSAFSYATAHGAQTAVITSGGELLKAAEKEAVPLVTIPFEKDIPARFMLGALLRGALEVLEKTGFIGTVDTYVKELKDGIDTKQDEKVNNLVEKMQNNIALLYTSPAIAGIGNIWKGLLNETAKLPAFANTLPEMTHNEIESLDALKKHSHLIFFQDPQEDEEQIQKSFKKVQKIAGEQGWSRSSISLEHKNRLVDLINIYILGILVSFSLAKKRDVNPLSTPLIDNIKKDL